MKRMKKNRYFQWSKIFLAVLSFILLWQITACQGNLQTEPKPTSSGKLNTLRIEGPLTMPFALPLISLIEHGKLNGLADQIVYESWKSPDELKADIVKKQADIFAVPTYTSANLYNRGLDVQYISTYLWGYLYMIGPKGEQMAWESLKGETVYIPFKGHVAEIMFRYLAERNGYQPDQDFQLVYASGPEEAVASLIMGKAKYVIISEQSATQAILKAKKEGVALDIVMDMQKEWGKATGREPQFPIGGVLISGELARNHPEIVSTLLNELAAETEWVASHPKEAGELAEKYFEGTSKDVIAQVVPKTIYEFKSTAEAAEDLKFFFEEIAKVSPDIIGGQLPDENFYNQSLYK